MNSGPFLIKETANLAKETVINQIRRDLYQFQLCPREECVRPGLAANYFFRSRKRFKKVFIHTLRRVSGGLQRTVVGQTIL